MTSGKVATTLGYERRNNPALRFSDRDAFVAFMTADQPVRPANIANIVAINQGKRPLTMEPPRARALTPEAVATRQAQGHVVVDTRPSRQFGEGHVPGSLHVHLSSPEFEQRVGWVVPPDVPFILVLERDDEADKALKALAFVGLDRRAAGYLAGSVDAWASAGHPIETLDQIEVDALHARLGADRALRVLDVRERSEWRAGHIEGAAQLSYKHLSARLGELDITPATEVAIVCHSGARSSTAASILKRRGIPRVANVVGGMVAWSAAGLPTVTR